MADNKNWLDDYMAYKMCCKDDGNSSGGSNSIRGCLPIIIAALLVFNLISMLVR